MNLGNLFTGLNNDNGDNNGIWKKSRTLFAIILVIIVVFLFGYGGYGFGLGGYGGSYGGGPGGYGASYGTYGAYGGYGFGDTYLNPRRRRDRHGHNQGYDEDIPFVYSAGYAYGAPGYGGYGGYGTPAGYGGYGRYGSGSYDWWFIIAVIALLFLLGGQSLANETNNTDGVS